MFKKVTFLATLFLSMASYAQVEVSKKPTPEINNATDGLYVNFADKGVLLPRVSLNSLTELKNSAGINFANTTDTSQMIVFNTNKALGEGFVFWDGAKWRALLDFENVIAQLNSSTMYYTESNGVDIPAAASYQQPAQNADISGYDYDQGFSESGSRSFLSLGVSKTIRTNRTTNKVTFTLTGIAQVAEASTNLTFGIGLFVDGALKYVENYADSFPTGITCGYITVDLEGVIEGLSTTQDHLIEARIHPRRATDIPAKDNNRGYSFGKPTGACVNLQDLSMKPKLVITVKE